MRFPILSSSVILILAGLSAACSSLESRSKAYREDLCSEDQKKNAPVVQSISPADGRRSGGTLVTIQGRGFAPGALVMIGKARCSAVSHLNESTLTCRTTRHAPEKVDVLVANPSRACGLLQSAFTYAPAVLIHPSTKLLAVTNGFTFQASRGVTPYAFDIVSGGGTIERDSGEFVAPAEAGTTVLKVTDSSGTSSEALVTINPALALIAPRHIMVNENYSFVASGGVPPYSFTLVSGDGSIDPSGSYRSPSEIGTDTVAVEDSVGNRSEAPVEIHPAFELSPNVRTIMVNNRMIVKGGAAPVTFSILSGIGSVDPVSGDFIAAGVPGTVSVRVQDSAGNFMDTQLVVEPALTVHPASKTITVGDTTQFIASGGVPPYQFSLAGGKGLLDNKGTYTAPDLPGTETLIVVDSLGNRFESEITISAEGMQLQKMVTGHSHRCVLIDGGVRCWGGNTRAQLGSTTARTREALPVPVEGLSTGVLGLAAGLNHTCALLNGGAVKCWGDNSYGQLGNGLTENSARPVKVIGLHTGVQAIAAGAYHTCATTNGTLLCWGDNRRGQLGNDSKVMSAVPVQVKWLTQGVQTASAGTFHSCALVSGGVKCWGYNFSGQLGDGTVTDHLTPVQVKGLESGVQSIDLGDFHSCAVLEDGVRCWGYNGSGQLGGAQGRNGLVPRKVSLPGVPVSLALGSYHTCALLPDQSVYCWGYNHEGQALPGTAAKVLTPQTVPFAQGAELVTAAANHSCVIIERKVHCWGWNGVTRFSPDPIQLR